MSIENLSYVEPLGANGKVILTSFPGLDINNNFQQNIFFVTILLFLN